MKIAQIFTSKIAYSLIALLLTVFLFVYVNSEHLNGDDNQSQVSTSLMKNTRATVKKEPNLRYNSNKYYVSGVPENVKVSLIGPSGLVKAAKNTGNFQLVADLSDLKPGTHMVKLKTSGLSSEVSARTDPEKIKVKISKKGQDSFPVQVRYNSSKIAKGYAAGVANSNRQSVKVTGASSDIKKIESIVADVNLSANVKSSVSRNVLLRAIDRSGKQLDVTISPQTARVNVPIYLASSHKSVPISLVSGGQGADGKDYDFTTDTKHVTLTGTKDALKKIDRLKVPVSIAGVSSDEDRTISLVSNRSGVTAVSPETIQVHINVKDNEEKASGSSSSSADTTSSSSTSSTSSNVGGSSNGSSTSYEPNADYGESESEPEESSDQQNDSSAQKPSEESSSSMDSISTSSSVQSAAGV